MIKTYFFVPLNNLGFVKKADNIETDHIVYDLEDAVGDGQESDDIVDNLKLISSPENSWVRPRISGNRDQTLSLLKRFSDYGINKFVLPKLKSYADFEEIRNYFQLLFSDFRIILLVENPNLLFDLDKILKKHIDVIEGVGLGSHDYCAAIGAKHVYDAYRFAHDFILNQAKVFGVVPIDIASMNIEDEEGFKQEVLQGFNKGYRSKFIIHPRQLDYLKTTAYFDEKEIAFAKKVFSVLDINSNFDAMKIDGKVIEKPHVARLNEIYKYLQYGTS